MKMFLLTIGLTVLTSAAAQARVYTLQPGSNMNYGRDTIVCEDNNRHRPGPFPGPGPIRTREVVAYANTQCVRQLPQTDPRSLMRYLSNCSAKVFTRDFDNCEGRTLVRTQLNNDCYRQFQVTAAPHPDQMRAMQDTCSDEVYTCQIRFR